MLVDIEQEVVHSAASNDIDPSFGIRAVFSSTVTVAGFAVYANPIAK